MRLRLIARRPHLHRLLDLGHPVLLPKVKSLVPDQSARVHLTQQHTQALRAPVARCERAAVLPSRADASGEVCAKRQGPKMGRRWLSERSLHRGKQRRLDATHCVCRKQHGRAAARGVGRGGVSSHELCRVRRAQGALPGAGGELRSTLLAGAGQR